MDHFQSKALSPLAEPADLLRVAAAENFQGTVSVNPSIQPSQEFSAVGANSVSRRDGRSELDRLQYSQAETARLLSVSVRSLARLRARGLIKPNIALRCVRYSRLEIERFVHETTV